MLPPDDSALLHAQPYDPKKAHEYYLRTRKLKGRRKGVQDEPASSDRTSRVSSSKVNRPKASNLHPIAASRQASLERRLDHLREVLARLVKQAQADSGSKAEEKSTETRKKGPPQSAQEKAKQAKRSKDFYEKNKKSPSEIKNKKDHDLQVKIQEIRQQIQKIQKELKAAIEKARTLTSNSKTAPKGR